MGQSGAPPVEQFRSGGGYDATALDELTHWSGHKSRLDQDLKGRYLCAGVRLRDGAAYAAEELVAEIGAAFLLIRGQHCLWSFQ